jgi:hypothetical protein
MNRILFIRDAPSGSDVEVEHFLSARGDITEWIQIMAKAYVVVSSSSPAELSTAFLRYLEKIGKALKDTKGRYLFITFGRERQGFLQAETWDKIKQFELGEQAKQ